jgi:hypothetical protein
VGAEPGETKRLATAVIGKHETPLEAERMIEQINREEFPKQPRIETLKKSLSNFYGKTRMLAFVYTKQAA